MAVVPFKRPDDRGKRPQAQAAGRRSFLEFATAMAVIGLALFLLPSLWSGVPQNMLAIVHLLVAVVYFQQGPRVAAGFWIALTLATLVVTGAPSPVTYALEQGARAADAALR
ncbi:hypothetical protein [Hansschlegelia plantiphila]|uniref:Uncharacterized protein n=1 Tax=Hansschlegelia plantiphila TaxID=374655 RepID=A0A9W6IX01_9HYPH|nr:hypothetical protein [Hansschlegelia plantiphila]GLK66587.1 hypothetical protein GCM10008179_02250 [Hansschlegelia plantiphila]